MPQPFLQELGRELCDNLMAEARRADRLMVVGDFHIAKRTASPCDEQSYAGIFGYMAKGRTGRLRSIVRMATAWGSRGGPSS